jgi:hypothetical protein
MTLNALFLMLGLFAGHHSHAASIADLSFLRGCWGVTSPNGLRLSEDWSQGNEDAMLGVSLTTDADNKTVETAFFEIRKNAASGELHFTPYLNGRSLGPYLMTELSSAADRRTAVFKNAQNKFLSEFIYSGTLSKTTPLLIELKGENAEGTPYAFRFELASEDCGTRY